MSPESLSKWEHILADVEKQKVPIQFLKKLILKLEGKRQQTINIERLMKQGLHPEELEDVVGRKLHELDEQIVSVEFILNVKSIADVVQAETDKILHSL